ncbi:hypothetical protein [Umezawaea beigongshangensis]|uniref:hypothetical protein n=1 Tax=Umezawaea beigongshangensis TaxID=2780383 RepID=UPI0027DCE378|nr:hypothetical protein [Umezawaea beigongshangensis]
MVWPPGSVNTSDQPLIGAGPVLVMVISDVRPPFQALTVSDTRHEASPGGSVVVGGPPWNWEKNRHTSPLVHVLTPLSQLHPSTAPGRCPPSKAAHTTGYPARHPVYAVVTCVRLPAAGSRGVVGVQPLLRTNLSRRDRPWAIESTESLMPWIPR